MLDRRGLLIANSQQGGRLPAEYQEVEYIEVGANDTEIATNFTMLRKYTLTTKIELADGIYPISNSNNFWFVAGGIYARNLLGINQNRNKQIHVWYGRTASSLWRYNYDGEPIKNIAFAQTYFTMNGVTNTNAEDNYSANPLCFMQLNPNTYGSEGASLYETTITDGNTMMADFVPCYRKADSEVGIYDLIAGEFYGNSSNRTGYFIAGGNI